MWAHSAYSLYRAAKSGDRFGMLMSGIGLIPGGKLLSSAGRAMRGLSSGARVLGGRVGTSLARSLSGAVRSSSAKLSSVIKTASGSALRTAPKIRVAGNGSRASVQLRTGGKLATTGGVGLGDIISIPRLTVSTALREAVCFVEDTLVLTADGSVEIQDIQTGDLVLSSDPDTGETAYKEVVNVFVKESHELIHISAGDAEIATTESHPFWVEDRGFVPAGMLMAGDMLRLSSGTAVAVDSVEREYLDEPITVYNFEVADWHTYFVSEIGVLVHNQCWVDSPKGTGEVGKDLEGLVKGRPKVEPGSSKVRDDKAKVKSDDFKDFLERLGETPSKWKYKMETWMREDGSTYERHYWTNGQDS